MFFNLLQVILSHIGKYISLLETLCLSSRAPSRNTATKMRKEFKAVVPEFAVTSTATRTSIASQTQAADGMWTNNTIVYYVCVNN